MNGPDIVGRVESYKAPVFDAAGNVLGTIGYARDIAEHMTDKSGTPGTETAPAPVPGGHEH